MKRLFTVLFFAALTSLQVNAQTGAAINTTGLVADPSAMLDVSSVNSGILIPRMTQMQKNAITNPATGLMIYQTDGSTGFWYYNGAGWVQSLGLTGATGAVGATGATGFLSSGATAGNTPYWDGTQWVVSSSNIYNNGGSVGIGTNNPDASALIEMSSTTKGTLITRMTTAQKNAISSPAQGLLIFNTTTNCFETYIGPIWQNFFCGCVQAPSAPSAGTHTASKTQITWNWGSVSGASGYKYNTVNNYATATDNGTSTSYIRTGITCSTSYTLYVWAYNNCGNSTVLSLSQSTASCVVCGVDNVTFMYRGNAVTYGTVVGQNSTCWLDRNLGASQVATAYNDANGYGDLFQWGRLDDGHQLRSNSATTTNLSTTDNPGHSRFIINTTSPNDWRSPANSSLWQGVSGTNNPCPTGWRVPTETELNNERLSWSPVDYNGAFSSPLKFTVGGQRNPNNANFESPGSGGDYWSSTTSGTNSKYMYFSSVSGFNPYMRGFGMSVRCIKD